MPWFSSTDIIPGTSVQGLGLGFTETFWFELGFCQNPKSGFVGLINNIKPNQFSKWPEKLDQSHSIS